MGLCGESGEAIDIVKKHLAQGHELDRELEEVLERNIEKLKKRYPEGFDKSKSINRED